MDKPHVTPRRPCPLCGVAMSLSTRGFEPMYECVRCERWFHPVDVPDWEF
jgi:hypothetical protein